MTSGRWALAAAALVVAVFVVVVVAAEGGGHSTGAAAQLQPPKTEKVEKGDLSALVSGAGTLTYRARPDGSPYTVVNQASGVYTELPEPGDKVGCGEPLYRVSNKPVLLLCGTVPVYRGLQASARGPDVRQLNRNLHGLRCDAAAHVRINPDDDVFTSKTQQALRLLQRRNGLRVTGALGSADAVFLPEAVRIAKVSGQLGGAAQRGAPALSATSNRLYVRVDLDAAQQGEVKKGDRAQITLPGNRPVTGRIAGFGRVAQAEQGGQAADATIPTFIDLERPAVADGLDHAPVDVDITTRGVANALSVPVTALVGKAGGGFAVELVHAGGARVLVPVRVGLFDTGGGRVQVEGALRAGDAVVVPSI